MTLDELQFIYKFINTSTMSCSKEDFKKINDLIEREINLKTMDPRKSKIEDAKMAGCVCIWEDVRIVTSNPHCKVHGIAQQSNKSQME